MRMYGSVVTPEGRFDVEASISGQDPRIRSVEDVRRLYESAPDLLLACEAADAWITAYVDGVGAEWDEMRAQLRAAIRRARGEA